MNFSETHQPMKVKAKYIQGHSYINFFGIYSWYLAALWIFDILFGFWDIKKKSAHSPQSENWTKACFSNFVNKPLGKFHSNFRNQ